MLTILMLYYPIVIQKMSLHVMGNYFHLTDAIGECQDLLSTAGNLHAPNQKYLLGNLVDVVQRVKEQSSSLLEMAVSELEKIDAESDEG